MSQPIPSASEADLASQAPHPFDNAALRRSPAFLPFSPQELRSVDHFRAGVHVFAPGQALIEEPVRSRYLYTLHRGWAFRYKSLSDGRRQILNFLFPGDFVGLQDEFADGDAHGVEAITEVSACAFLRDRLWDLFAGHPRLGYDITWLSARQEAMVDDNLLSVGRRTALERVAMLLMHIYRRAQRVGMEEGGAVPFPLNQQHMADALGLSLVHTNKTLGRLQKLGLHRIDKGQLRILDPQALASLADYFARPQRPTPLI